jgi:hypothetical protein
LTTPDRKRDEELAMRERFLGAETLDELAAGPIASADMWRTLIARHHAASAAEDIVSRAVGIGGTWHLLALIEDWCGDAFNTVPTLGALAGAAPGIDLRVLRRDQHLDLMDLHLSPTGGRAIPVVIVLDDQFVERGWWGSRPSELQRWLSTPEALAMEKADRYKATRLWYVRDRGHSTQSEVLDVIETAAGLNRTA